MDPIQETQRLIPIIRRTGDLYVKNKLGQIEVVESHSLDDLVTTSDLNISKELLSVAREKLPLSFTEESFKSNPKSSARNRLQKGYR